MDMAAMQALILLASVLITSGQRPFFAGSRPIGYPELLNKTTTTPSGLEDKFGEVTTQRLPIEAGGDRELVDRLSKLPIDKQPFWLINWQALQANREKPQTYPLKPSPFLESTFQNPNIAPINNPNSNANTGFFNPNAAFSNPNTGFVNNPGVGNPNPGFGNSNTGFGNPNPGLGNTNSGFVSPNPGFGNNNPKFSNVNPNPVSSNPGFAGANPSFGNANTGNTGNANFGNRVQSPDLKGQDLSNTNGNSSVENRYGTETTPIVNTSIGTAVNKTPATSNNGDELAVTNTDVNNKHVHSHEEDEFEDIEVKKFYKNH